MTWLTIPEQWIEDKPLPDGYFWYTEEDHDKHVSIRIKETLQRDGRDSTLVLGIRQEGANFIVLTHNADGGGHNREHIDGGFKEAVNLIYARFMLGETQ
jgi:hypothetical protein